MFAYPNVTFTFTLLKLLDLGIHNPINLLIVLRRNPFFG
jgi:hypothetical protein